MTVSPLTHELCTWLASCRHLIEDYYEEQLQSIPRENYPTLCRIDGKRYIKIVHIVEGSRSAWAFIDKETGDVLKPASWRAPAKHARGNIFDEWNGMRFMTVFGPAYLR